MYNQMIKNITNKMGDRVNITLTNSIGKVLAQESIEISNGDLMHKLKLISSADT